jgi:hypothetical protein
MKESSDAGLRAGRPVARPDSRRRALLERRGGRGGGENAGAIAFAQDGDEACVQVFFMRGGNIVGRSPIS